MTNREKLLAALRRPRGASASELAARLGIQQPSVRSLISTARANGAPIVRVGGRYYLPAR